MDSSGKRKESVADPDCISESHSSTRSDSSISLVGTQRISPQLIQHRRRPKDTGEPGGVSASRFMQCCVEMRDVPVQDAWAFFRDRQAVANLIPGILVGLNYLDGDGAAGSICLSTYTPKCSKPGEDRYVMHQVELRDDISHLHVVRCVGGKYKQRYKLYLSFLKILPDVAFGDSSCTVIWRGEYQLLNPDAAAPEDSMAAQKYTMEMFRNIYNISKTVDRPISNCSAEPGASQSKPWRLRGKHIGPSDTTAVEVSPQRRRRKPRVQCLIKNVKAKDGEEDEKQKRTRGRSDNKCRTGAVGQRAPRNISTELPAVGWKSIE